MIPLAAQCRNRLAVALLIIAALMLPLAPAPAQAQDDAWSSLGPAGARNSDRVYGVASTWPQDRLLLATYQGWLARSEDDGATWTRLAARFKRPRALWPAPGVDTSRIVFAIDDVETYERGDLLYRSTDAGITWSLVLEPGKLEFGKEQDALTFSPAFAEDGAAFLRAGGGLHRTEDFGATWSKADLAPAITALEHDGVQQSQLVQSVQLSPNFGTDRTVFVTAGTALYYPGPFDYSRQREAEGLPPAPTEFHRRSLGVAVSHDAGQTWKSTSAGFQIDGDPARYVVSLAISPTFEGDQTIFAWSWGVSTPAQIEQEQRLRIANALFRSQDAGQTWSLIWDQPTSVVDSGPGSPMQIAISSAFNVDGTVIVAVTRPAQLRTTTGPIPEDRKPDIFARCDIYRTRDTGRTWERVQGAERRPVYQDCGRLLSQANGDIWRLMMTSVSGNFGRVWLLSTDQGSSWQTLAPHPKSEYADVPVPRVLGPGGELLAAGGDGFWAHGGPAPAQPGVPSCPFEIADALVSTLRGAFLSNDFGCAVEAAHPVTVRERRVGSMRGLWFENNDPDWLLLRGRAGRLEPYLDDSGAWERRSKADEPWTGPPDRILEALVQRTWGGLLLRVTSPMVERGGFAIKEPSPASPTEHFWHETNPDHQRQ